MSKAMPLQIDSNFECWNKISAQVLLNPVVYEMFWQIVWFITFLNFIGEFCDTCHEKSFDGLTLKMKNYFGEEIFYLERL